MKYSNNLNKIKIIEAFNKVKKDINDLKEGIVSKKEIELMIKDALRQQLRGVTPRSTTPNQLKSIQKKVLKELDTAQLMKAIYFYIQEGYTTNHIKDEVMNRFNIKSTCFFKYLNEVRQQLRGVTTRSNYAEFKK